MSRGKARFQAADVERAIKGAEAAGKLVARVEFDRDGKMVVVIGKPGGDCNAEANEWDELKNGKDSIEACKRVPQQKPE
jgi:hypothetical protein